MMDRGLFFFEEESAVIRTGACMQHAMGLAAEDGLFCKVHCRI